MSPLLTHRRSRRRSRAGRLVVVVCVLVVVAVLIGGVARIGSGSGPFHASVNRSFGAQGAVLVDLSNATGASLRRLMEAMPDQSRQTLQVELDDITAQAGDQAARAAFLASDGDVEGRFAAVFADRARSADEVRSAIDGLLGLRPLPVAGTPVAPATVAPAPGVASPTLLSSTQVTDRIAAAGRLLARADRSYQVVRRSLADMAGHARLPASRWISTPSTWQIGAVATQVDLDAASTTLAATPQLGLSVVQITPPAVPSPSGAVTPGVSVLSPTEMVVLNVVLTNDGTVDEPHASVRFTLARLPTGATAMARRAASVLPGRSVTLAPVTFAVKPGSSYQLTVAITVPAGQTVTAGTTFVEGLQISPST
jgi:hypothetical protein